MGTLRFSEFIAESTILGSLKLVCVSLLRSESGRESSRVGWPGSLNCCTRVEKQSFRLSNNGWKAIIEHHTQIRGKLLHVFASPSSSSLNTTMNQTHQNTAFRNTKRSLSGDKTPQHNSYMLERVFSLTRVMNSLLNAQVAFLLR